MNTETPRRRSRWDDTPEFTVERCDHGDPQSVYRTEGEYIAEFAPGVQIIQLHLIPEEPLPRLQVDLVFENTEVPAWAIEGGKTGCRRCGALTFHLTDRSVFDALPEVCLEAFELILLAKCPYCADAFMNDTRGCEFHDPADEEPPV